MINNKTTEVFYLPFFNPFQSSVAFQIVTILLICDENQTTGFLYELQKWAKMG